MCGWTLSSNWDLILNRQFDESVKFKMGVRTLNLTKVSNSRAKTLIKLLVFSLRNCFLIDFPIGQKSKRQKIRIGLKC